MHDPPPLLVSRFVCTPYFFNAHAQSTVTVSAIWRMEDEDVPPLEDLTEVVQRARGLRAQPPNDPRMRSDVWVAAQETGVADGKASSFGGFSKGFLLSSSNSKKSQKTTSQSSRAASQAAAKDDGDIPFLRPSSAAAAETRGPVFPEVQEAMKEAYPLLNTQEWMTQSLLEKIEKHPLLSRALRDPNLARAMSQFQSDPQTVLQAAAGNPEMQTFLKEFCVLMGDHFTELADKQEESETPARGDGSKPAAIDREVQKVLGKKGVKEALSDLNIQQLFKYLKEDTSKAQRLLTSAGPDLRQKVQLLIDNGLLALQ